GTRPSSSAMDFTFMGSRRRPSSRMMAMARATAGTGRIRGSERVEGEAEGFAVMEFALTERAAAGCPSKGPPCKAARLGHGMAGVSNSSNGSYGALIGAGESPPPRARSGRRSMWPQFTFRLAFSMRSEEHTSELQSRENLVCRLLLE